jgi:quinol monooxygenase YgiN
MGPALIAKITAQPGKRAELVDALQAMVDHVETEPGTLVYLMHTDTGDPDVVWFYERYESHEALQAHGTSETMQAVGAAVAGLVAAAPELIVLDIVGGKGA